MILPDVEDVASPARVLVMAGTMSPMATPIMISVNTPAATLGNSLSATSPTPMQAKPAPSMANGRRWDAILL